MAEKKLPEITKKQIRTDIIAKRDALTEGEKKAASDIVKDKLISDPFFVKAKRQGKRTRKKLRVFRNYN
jgi:5-formyltetrahydrofolate cyclo-ligase